MRSMSFFSSLKRQLEKNDEFLTISLGDDPPNYYFPGQTLSGWVGRRERLENGEATVTIQLAGSSQVKIFDPRGYHGHGSTNSSSEEHEFVGLGDPVCIFKGPVQDVSRAADDQHWTKFPFTITIPKEPFAPHQGDDKKPGETAVRSENAPVVLPASYERRHAGIDQTADLKVTYRLDAKLSIEPGQSWTTHLPLTIRTAGKAKPIPDCYITRLPTRVVRSPRLVPGQENAGIGIRTKARKLFGSSKVPAFAFALIIRSPIEIQLDHDTSNPFAFQVEATSDWSKTSESLAKTAQKPTVKSFKLDLVTNTYMSTGSASPRSFDATESVPLIDYTYGNASWKPQPPPSQTDELAAVLKSFNKDHHDEVPPAAAGAIGPLIVRLDDDTSALDLGRKFPCGLDTKAPLGSRLTAGFVLPNARVWHLLRWELNIELAGEEEVVKGQQAVTVLNPSAESIYY